MTRPNLQAVPTPPKCSRCGKTFVAPGDVTLPHAQCAGLCAEMEALERMAGVESPDPTDGGSTAA